MIKTNDFLNRLARNEDEKRLLARSYELVLKAAHGTVGSGDFLDLRQQELAQAVAVNEPSVRWHFDGGYEEAERKRLVVYPDWELKADARITCLRICHKEFQDISLGHRDYLGAVLNLGIKREKLGDIVVQPSMAFLFLDLELTGYLCQQLTRVKNTNVWAEIIDCQDFVFQAPELQARQLSLASLRLDAAIAATYNISRADVDIYISSGNVKINQMEVYKPATSLKIGDLISVRGRGRFRLEGITGMSRKGRYQVEISRW